MTGLFVEYDRIEYFVECLIAKYCSNAFVEYVRTMTGLFVEYDRIEYFIECLIAKYCTNAFVEYNT